MKKFLILPALLIGALSAQADVLSPAAALTRAAAELPASAAGARRVASRAAAGAEPMMTIAENALTPELYVFAADGGVLVASAESETPALLGYSDFYQSDAALPPSMLWLLNQYAAEIRALRAGNVIPAEKSAASRADFEPLDPICSTMWNQGAPYNDQCPKISGKATYTGCVATAIAQVLNVLKYPETCSGGTYSYYWTNGNQTLTKNFNEVTLDWKNMDDVYTGSSFSTKRKAVANLMAAVGYAADMNYGTDASGAHGLYACAGLIRNFDYEYTLKYLMRDWFALADWQKMVYDEIASGVPVYYDGVNSKEKVGHAFVIDGYQADGFFHVNWGWGGSLNGYFQLTALDPQGQQGIGGSSGGYSEQSGAFFGFTKGRTMTAETAPYTFTLDGNLSLRTSAITLGSNFPVSFTDGGTYNYSPFTATGVGYCLKFTAANGAAYYSTVASTGSTAPYYGVSGFNTSVPRTIPAGSYTVTVAVQNPNTKEYFDTYANISKTWRKTAEINTATVKFTDYVEPIGDVLALTDAATPSSVYFGEEFNATVSLVNNTAADYAGTVELNLYQSGTATKISTLGTASASVAAGKTAEVSIAASIAAGSVEAGNYSLGFATADGVAISPLKGLTVAGRPVEVEGSDFVCTETAVSAVGFKLNLTARGAEYSGKLTFAIARSMTAEPVWSRSIYLTIGRDQTVEQKFEGLDISDLASIGRNYIIYAAYVDASGANQFLSGTDRIIFVPTAESGIDEVEANGAQIEYFDLGGRRVANPAKGIYIRRQGSNTQTVHIK